MYTYFHLYYEDYIDVRLTSQLTITIVTHAVYTVKLYLQQGEKEFS